MAVDIDPSADFDIGGITDKIKKEAEKIAKDALDGLKSSATSVVDSAKSELNDVKDDVDADAKDVENRISQLESSIEGRLSNLESKAESAVKDALANLESKVEDFAKDEISKVEAAVIAKVSPLLLNLVGEALDGVASELHKEAQPLGNKLSTIAVSGMGSLADSVTKAKPNIEADVQKLLAKVSS